MGIDLSSILNSGYKANANTGLNINNFSYYSGSQITIWFGDILLDDIMSIQWTRHQSKRPIYGYASQKFDSVANGTVIVQGSFVLNFRQAGYLPVILNKISRLYSDAKNNQVDSQTIRDVIGYYLKSGMFGPTSINNSAAAVKTQIEDIGNSDDFMALAKAYEDVIWGGGVPGAGELPDQGKADTMRRFMPADIRQAKEIPSGFNILITYGSTNGSEPKNLNDYIQSTTKSIVGVHLMGDSQIINVGGQPVLEQYDFIAQDTDGQLKDYDTK